MSPIGEGGILLDKTKHFLTVWPRSLKASSVSKTAEKVQFFNKYCIEAYPGGKKFCLGLYAINLHLSFLKSRSKIRAHVSFLGLRNNIPTTI